MIIKSYELKKLNLDKNKYILFYGANEGAKTEEINRLKFPPPYFHSRGATPQLFKNSKSENSKSEIQICKIEN